MSGKEQHMAWKLSAWGMTRMPLTGIPWRDLTDEEFAAAEERYPELRGRGYFEETEEVTEDGAPRRSPSATPRGGGSRGGER